ncbi:hypothetical protein EMN47_09865 [Prolixibacteraceae bacterium JC049]|nr:hypothetical protein [Prolixibacteraceae bacterium JC049]
MKKHISYILIGILSFGLFACQDQTEVYEEFVIPGGKSYPGQVIAPMVFSGKNRVLIVAKAPVDPLVTEMRVYRNYYKDSIVVSLEEKKELIELEINGLEEENHTFAIKTIDANGNKSVPRFLFGSVYGDNYKKRISNRTFVKAVVNDEGALKVDFGDADISNGAIESWVNYVNNEDQEVVTKVSVQEESVTITDFKSSAKYLTRFLPAANCIDTFSTDFANISVLKKIENAEWEVIDYSTQHSDGENAAANFIDGDNGTRWHSKAGGSDYPHHITVDLGKSYNVAQFELFRMKGDDRGPDKFELFVSTDAENWTKLGAFDFNRKTDDGQLYSVTPTNARYFKYVATEGGGSKPDRHVMGDVSVYEAI